MLKSLLSLLLSKFYSKQENDTISHLATPTINNSVNVALATDANSVIVAPFDGYLNIETTPEGNPTINVWEALWCNSTPISPAQAKLFVPVTKGQRIQYRVTGTISQARFVRLVGGGYQSLKNALLQGGGLCLNSLFSSLRRISLLVRRRVFRTGQTSKTVPQSKSQYQRALTLLPTWRHQMVSFSWNAVMAQKMGITLTFVSIGLSTLREYISENLSVGQSYLLGSQKEIRSLSHTQNAVQEMFADLSRSTNFVVGGASC